MPEGQIEGATHARSLLPLPLGFPLLNPSIQERIGGGIIALARGPHQGTEGRQAQEKVQRILAREVIEINGSLHLGPQDSPEGGPVFVDQKRIFNQAGGMDHATQGPARLASSVDHGDRPVPVAHIGRHVGDLGPLGPPGFQARGFAIV